MRKILCLVLIAMWTTVLAQSALAGVTGKIAGRVTDSESGDGLPGTNVIIKGTNLGAATDLDGNFTILNVPPGLYTVQFSFIGYQPVHVKDVRVNIDLTARVNRQLQPSALELGAVEVDIYPART